jgi:hypothetical protein
MIIRDVAGTERRSQMWTGISADANNIRRRCFVMGVYQKNIAETEKYFSKVILAAGPNSAFYPYDGYYEKSGYDSGETHNGFRMSLGTETYPWNNGYFNGCLHLMSSADAEWNKEQYGALVIGNKAEAHMRYDVNEIICMNGKTTLNTLYI